MGSTCLEAPPLAIPRAGFTLCVYSEYNYVFAAWLQSTLCTNTVLADYKLCVDVL